MIQILEHDARPTQPALTCEVCGTAIDSADLRLLHDVDAIPEAMNGHYVHKACLARFMQAQGPSKHWERYDVASPEAAWFLPVCTTHPSPTQTAPTTGSYTLAP